MTGNGPAPGPQSLAAVSSLGQARRCLGPGADARQREAADASGAGSDVAALPRFGLCPSGGGPDRWVSRPPGTSVPSPDLDGGPIAAAVSAAATSVGEFAHVFAPPAASAPCPSSRPPVAAGGGSAAGRAVIQPVEPIGFSRGLPPAAAPPHASGLGVGAPRGSGEPLLLF